MPRLKERPLAGHTLGYVSIVSETIAKISEAMTGRKRSAETIVKMREALTGKKYKKRK